VGNNRTVSATDDGYFRLCHLIIEAYVLKYIVVELLAKLRFIWKMQQCSPI